MEKQWHIWALPYQQRSDARHYLDPIRILAPPGASMTGWFLVNVPQESSCCCKGYIIKLVLLAHGVFVNVLDDIQTYIALPSHSWYGSAILFYILNLVLLVHIRLLFIILSSLERASWISKDSPFLPAPGAPRYVLFQLLGLLDN